MLNEAISDVVFWSGIYRGRPIAGSFMSIMCFRLRPKTPFYG